MSEPKATVYPYIPNSAPRVRAEMLEAIGVQSVDELYADVPEELRLKRRLNLPPPLLSEAALRRHVEGILGRNRSCKQLLSFLGAGCWQHYVPAVCDEINSRTEFLTAYAGEPYEDHGRFQALFEYTSMMGELLEMDVVSVPTYDGFQAVATSIRMAARMTSRRRVLLPATMGADKLSKIRDYCAPEIDLVQVDWEPASGLMNLEALKRALTERTAAVVIENPSYLGMVEVQGPEIGRLAHAVGAELIANVDPISLGVLAAPASYGADIACGDIQPLGMHMQFGGGHAGFIATRDEERYVMQYPSRLFGIAPTSVPGEYGFGDVAYERTSFAVREEGREWVGTAAALWGITAGVYLALLGPQGLAELGEGIMQRSRYAMQRIGELAGVRCPVFCGPHFKEFVVNLDGTGKTVTAVNAGLLERGILGGKDLSDEIPTLGQSALYCVTEMHTQQDLDRLVDALREVIG